MSKQIFRIAVAACLVATTTLAQEQVDHEAHLKNEDGSWKFTNKLIDSSSPYLRQHAHNPVDWYPWGPEAIDRARAEDKPIFVSIGYSTCYWCHVMERLVFSDLYIASLMNESFINIKVDREERPDLDEIYMTATQIVTRRGGWPNSVFLTPDLKPFSAGTYYGPEDMQGRPGFPTLLSGISRAWIERRADIDQAADQIAQRIAATLGSIHSAPQRPLDHRLVDAAFAQLSRSYDDTNGGFSTQPKFPNDFAYPFLFAYADRTGDKRAETIALHTLDMMAMGGIHDHVGGGFHRYATDARWRVPHFEKMLYNQAMLCESYADAYVRTGNELYNDAMRGILRYVAEHMTGPDGQFYSALDAETNAVEGAYYVWSKDELRDLLDDTQRASLEGVVVWAPVPIFAGHPHPDGKVLCLDPDTVLPDPALRKQIRGALKALEHARSDRQLPRLDDKVITAWNGMMIRGLARANIARGGGWPPLEAMNAATFILDNSVVDGRLMRIWNNGVASQPAFHDDYAHFIAGLTALHEATGENKWLAAAVTLTAQADELFWDDANGGYYFAVAASDLIARSKSPRDSAVPSGNAAMVHALIELAAATGDRAYLDRAQETLDAFSGSMAQQPGAHTYMAYALERYLAAVESADAGTSITPIEPDPDDVVSLVVAVTPARVLPGDEFSVTITVRCDTGWHVNANPASMPYLIPTSADVRSDGVAEVIDVAYPQSVKLKTSFTDQLLAVYEDRSEIVVRLRLTDGAKPGMLPLRIAVGYQACNDSMCLMPKERILDATIAVLVGVGQD